MELASGCSEGAESLYSLLTGSLPPVRVRASHRVREILAPSPCLTWSLVIDVKAFCSSCLHFPAQDERRVTVSVSVSCY